MDAIVSKWGQCPVSGLECPWTPTRDPQQLMAWCDETSGLEDAVGGSRVMMMSCRRTRFWPWSRVDMARPCERCVQVRTCSQRVRAF
mmetsp:Transcript_101969/g.327204  ORF Transcript_101969/g.327204 Transcript_101969/m.327204 type:complete len:87 (+) Transcript_101969:507-767(+)